MEYGGHVYIMTNLNNTTLYTGVSSDLYGRVWQHKQKMDPNSFTAKYNCVKLVWYEFHISIEEAIAREKQIKKWRRVKKIALVESFNPAWKDLFDDLES